MSMPQPLSYISMVNYSFSSTPLNEDLLPGPVEEKAPWLCAFGLLQFQKRLVVPVVNQRLLIRRNRGVIALACQLLRKVRFGRLYEFRVRE